MLSNFILKNKKKIIGEKNGKRLLIHQQEMKTPVRCVVFVLFISMPISPSQPSSPPILLEFTRVILFFQIIQIDCSCLPQCHQLFVAFRLLRSIELRMFCDCFIDWMEVVQNEVLFYIRYQFDEGFASSNCNERQKTMKKLRSTINLWESDHTDVRGSDLHLVCVLFTLRDLGKLRIGFAFC